jgi:hypothetical protein
MHQVFSDPGEGPMTLDEFRASLTAGSPPSGLTPPLEALWHDAKGDWTRAHSLAQQVESVDGAWVHAYLHRKEGDLGNAGYWYRRAGRSKASMSLEEEWAAIAEALLGSRQS